MTTNIHKLKILVVTEHIEEVVNKLTDYFAQNENNHLKTDFHKISISYKDYKRKITEEKNYFSTVELKHDLKSKLIDLLEKLEIYFRKENIEEFPFHSISPKNGAEKSVKIFLFSVFITCSLFACFHKNHALTSIKPIPNKNEIEKIIISLKGFILDYNFDKCLFYKINSFGQSEGEKCCLIQGVRNDKLKQVLNDISNLNINNSELKNQVDCIWGWLSNIENREINGCISENYYTSQRNLIRTAIRKIIDELNIEEFKTSSLSFHNSTITSYTFP